MITALITYVPGIKTVVARPASIRGSNSRLFSSVVIVTLQTPRELRRHSLQGKYYEPQYRIHAYLGCVNMPFSMILYSKQVLSQALC